MQAYGLFVSEGEAGFRCRSWCGVAVAANASRPASLESAVAVASDARVPTVTGLGLGS